MSWRGAGGQARAVAERRLVEVARQWSPAPVADPWPTAAEAPAIHVGSWRRPALRALVLLVAAALAFAGYTAWLGRPREVASAPTVVATGVPLVPTGSPTPVADPEPVPEPAVTPPPSPAVVVVHVVGQVARPGLVRLPVGARVADAIDAAGGLTRPRAADSVNLARELGDGEQVVVGAAPGAVPAAGSASPAPSEPAVLDLNTASVEQLDTLPGVGPVLAARIVAWRAANGPFRSIDELGEVSGIGESILSQVRSRVRV